MPDRTAGSVFQRWLQTEIRPFLADRGWSRRGLVFERPMQANTAMIQFVRWKGSTAAHYDFWLEAAVFSPRVADELAQQFGEAPPSQATVYSAAATVRLADLLRERTDVVWRVRADALGVQLAALGDVVRENLVAQLFPWVESHATDEQLRDEMLDRADRARGPSLLLLRRLVADLGPADQLPRVDALIARWNERPPLNRVGEALANPFAPSQAEVEAADAAMLELERLGITKRRAVD